MLISPQDGQVYYSSSLDDFKQGTAKTNGKYFYVDTNEDGFYETVFVLSADSSINREGMPEYDVMCIGLNYDAIHDFKPYERISTSKVEGNFDSIAGKSFRSFSGWVFRYGNLKSNAFNHIWTQLDEEQWKNYRPMDQIFEIYKLSEQSQHNPKFSINTRWHGRVRT
jgi:hypothetical protein